MSLLHSFEFPRFPLSFSREPLAVRFPVSFRFPVFLRPLRFPLVLEEEADFLRPKQRFQCASVARPCHWVGCQYNLYWEHLKRFPGIDPDQMPAELSCVLDIAESGGLEEGELSDLLCQPLPAVRREVEKALNALRFKIARLPIASELRESF